MTFSNCSRDSPAIDRKSLVASTAACSSRRGMVSGFSGATLDLACVILVALGLPTGVGASSRSFAGCVRKDAEYWNSHSVRWGRGPLKGHVIQFLIS